MAAFNVNLGNKTVMKSAEMDRASERYGLY
jgi:hypothetical protein